MSDEKVEYELSLKDGLSPKVEEANTSVNKLEHSIHGLGERIAHVAEAFEVSFAIFKGIEFIKEAKEDWERLEFANSQLEAGLESTGHAAGIAMEDLKESAEGFSHTFKFTKAEVEDMQSILLTFPSVTKATFNDASQAVLDMATRLGTDAKSAAVQLGKALQDPVQGISALHRVGVNTDELKKKFETVTDTLQRQKLIIRELNEEFGGSAKAAAEADVSFRYEKSMKELSETVGEIADKILAVVAPAFEAFADGLKNTVEWMKKHADLLKAIAIGVGVAAAAWGVYELVANASAIATSIMTAAQWALNAAMDANPIGIIIVALGALVAATVYAYNKLAWFRAGLWGIWETIKEFGRIVGDVFMGLWHTIHGVFTFNGDEITQGLNQSVSAIADSGKRLGAAFKKGYEDGLKDFATDHKEETLIPKKPLKAKALPPGAAVKEPKNKGTGSKSVTINVSIKDLIGVQNINTTTLKEGAGKIRDMVVSVLTGAVNDFQVVAEH